MSKMQIYLQFKYVENPYKKSSMQRKLDFGEFEGSFGN